MLGMKSAEEITKGVLMLWSVHILQWEEWNASQLAVHAASQPGKRLLRLPVPNACDQASRTKRCDVDTPRNWEVRMFIQLLGWAVCRLSPGSLGRAASRHLTVPGKHPCCKCWFKKHLTESIKASYGFTGYFGNCHVLPINCSCRFMFCSAFAFKTRQAKTWWWFCRHL